jgi:hypothetical protein
MTFRHIGEISDLDDVTVLTQIFTLKDSVLFTSYENFVFERVDKSFSRGNRNVVHEKSFQYENFDLYKRKLFTVI